MRKIYIYEKIKGIRWWENLPPYEPMLEIKKIEKKYKAYDIWKLLPANMNSSYVKGQGIIGISPDRIKPYPHEKVNSQFSTESHEYGHFLFEILRIDHRIIKSLIAYYKDCCKFDDRYLQIDGNLIDIKHGNPVLEFFPQMFTYYEANILTGDNKKIMDKLVGK